MPRYSSLTLMALIALPLSLTQCTTTHMQMDQTQLREVLVDYTENQIVDNVIRARNSMPIIHMDMEHVDAVVKTSLSASVGGGHTRTSSIDRSRSSSRNFEESDGNGYYGGGTTSSRISRYLGFTTGLAASVTRPFSWSTAGERDNTIDVQMIPVMDENAVYDAYEKFVNLNGGDSVRDSLHFAIPDTKAPHPDDPDGVHVGKKWRGVFYWVPNKYKKEFFKLSLAAGVKRDARNAARRAEGDGLKQAGAELRRMRLY